MNSNQIVSTMSSFLHVSAIQLAEWLSPRLSKISDNWWQECVLVNLSNKDKENKRNASKLNDLDLAGLLHIADKNLYRIKEDKYLSAVQKPQETIINKMLNVRHT